MSDPYRYNMQPYQRGGGPSNYGQQPPGPPTHYGHQNYRGSPGYQQHPRGGSRGWSQNPNSYNQHAQYQQHHPHDQAAPYQHHQQQQHYPQQQQQWGHRGAVGSNSSATRYTQPVAENFGYSHENSDRRHYESGEDHNRYRSHSGSAENRVDETRRKNSAAEDHQRRRTSPTSETRSRRSATMSQQAIVEETVARPDQSFDDVRPKNDPPKIFSPSKRRLSFDEIGDDGSDSDALVIDIGETDAKNVSKIDTRSGAARKCSVNEPEDELEAQLAEITGEKPKIMTRKRRSSIDKTDEEKSPQKSGSRDYKIPKKRNSGPEINPDPTTGSNPLASPKTEMKFELVEDALEAMFAGVSGEKDEKKVKTEPNKDEAFSTSKATPKSSKPPTRENSAKPTIVKEPSKPQPKAAPKKKAPAKKSAKPSQQQQEVKFCSANLNGNSRINRKKKVATTQQEILLEKYRGPFVRIDGDPNSPSWTRLVNSTTDPLSRADESNATKPELEMKVRSSGFGTSYSTTLNSKYDAKKPDESWSCIFCKKPSHFKGLGDLFGPYYAGKDVINSVSQRSPQKKQDLASKFIIGGADKKKRRKLPNSPDDAGFDLPSPIQQQLQTQQNVQANGVEVWFHEDCICWMPMIKLVGHNVLGLDDAIRASHKELCVRCHVTGSTVGCIKTGCRQTSHFFCAIQSNWLIDRETFQALCSVHTKCDTSQQK